MSIDPDRRALSFQAASVALIVALAGCASHSEPSISDSTRAKLAHALQANGDSVNAAAVMQGEAGPGPKTTVDPLTHIKALVAAGDVDRAMTAAKAALATNGDDPAYILAVGRIAVMSGRLNEAEDFYRQATRRNPDSVEALNGKGVVQAQQGDLNAAAETLRKALTSHPTDVATRNNLALVMTLQGDADAALDLLAVIDQSHPSPQLSATLALAHERSRVRKVGHVTPVDPAASGPLRTAGIPTPTLPRERVQAKAADKPAVIAGQAAPVVVPEPSPLPPAQDEAARRIVLRARTDSWMLVRDASGQVLLNKELRPGETWSVPTKPGLVLATGNAGGTELLVDGVVAAPLGGAGKIRRDVPLDADVIKGGKLAAQLRAARANGSI